MRHSRENETVLESWNPYGISEIEGVEPLRSGTLQVTIS